MEIIMGKKLYVGNLRPDIEDANLQEWFSAFGTVVSANVVKDRMTGEGRGFGFVEMESSDEAEAAKTGLDGQERDGQTLKVNDARPKPPRREGGRGYGGGRREGGGGGSRGY